MRLRYLCALAILLGLSVCGEVRAQTLPSLSLSWTDNSTDETTFNIYRCSGVGCTVTQTTPFASVGANVTTYTDAALQQATNYCYGLDAANSAGKSSMAGPACAVTNAQLVVAKTGTGTGTVSSSPTGITCGATCNAWFAGNSLVTLTATPAAGSVFTGWSGACTGTGSCSVQMSGAKNVTAGFGPTPTAPNAPTNFTVK